MFMQADKLVAAAMQATVAGQRETRKERYLAMGFTIFPYQMPLARHSV
jgi:hypothetical protein